MSGRREELMQPPSLLLAFSLPLHWVMLQKARKEGLGGTNTLTEPQRLVSLHSIHHKPPYLHRNSVWTGQGVTSPLQHNSHQSRILPGGSYLHPRQSPRHTVGPLQSRVGINEGPRDGRPKSPHLSPHPEEKPPRCQCPGTWAPYRGAWTGSGVS